MAQLTSRQTEILKAIIQEFIETAEPVGSEKLERKFSLGVSPATIRNEMIQLTQLGFLKKPHASAGRMPTSMGLKYFVKNLMTPKKLSVAEEVGVKEKVWDCRRNVDLMLKEATKELSRRTQLMGVATTDKGDLYTYGASNLLDYQEFFDIDVTKMAISLLDRADFWLKIVERTFSGNESEPFYLLVGDELADFLEPVSFTYQTYQSGGNRGLIGVVGPYRARYTDVVPLVDYVAHLISQFGQF